MRKVYAITMFALLAGLSANAQNYIWAKKVAGSDQDYAQAMVTDTEGNVYITGGFIGSMDADPGSGVTILTSASGSVDIFFAKYDSSGTFIYAKSLMGFASQYAYDLATGIAVDALGNVYITGSISNEVDFDPGEGTAILTPTFGGDPKQNLFLAKYDPQGNYVWAKNFGQKAFSSDQVNIALDLSGNIYLSGYLYGGYSADYDGGDGVATLTAIGYRDVFMAKYDNDGNYMWAQNIGSSQARAYSYSIKTDHDGDVYIAGTADNFVDFDPSDGTAMLNGGSGSAFFAKYDTDGNYLWAKNFEGGESSIVDMDLDASNNIYVAGLLKYTADFDPGDATANLSGISNLNEYFYAKYDAMGNYIFANYLPSSNISSATSKIKIAIDHLKNIYVAGYYEGSANDIDPGVPVVNLPAGPGNFFAKFDSIGQYQWAKTISGASVFTTSIKATASDEIYLTGSYFSTTDFNPSFGVANLTSSGGGDIFIAKYTVGNSTTGIGQLTGNPESTIYPNPFTNTATLKINATSQLNNAELRIYDVLGKEVKQISINSPEISISRDDLKNGLYIYRLTNNLEIIATGKIIIQ